MTLLLLAGTREARLLAADLADAGIATSARLAGATTEPAKLAVPVQTGGFGGSQGFRDFLQSGGIRAVIDATHPFAARITPRTIVDCQAMSIPYLRLERPAWVPGPDDNWHNLERPEDLATALKDGAVVFLATGRQSLLGFSELRAKAVYLRQIEPPDRPFPFPDGGYVIGRPPFSVESETETLSQLRITDLVVKNAGGDGGRAKLTAAARLGITVWMIERPLMPGADRVETVEEALKWAMSQSV